MALKADRYGETMTNSSPGHAFLYSTVKQELYLPKCFRTFQRLDMGKAFGNRLMIKSIDKSFVINSFFQRL